MEVRSVESSIKSSIIILFVLRRMGVRRDGSVSRVELSANALTGCFFSYNGEAVVQGSLDIGMPIIYVSMNYR